MTKLDVDVVKLFQEDSGGFVIDYIPRFSPSQAKVALNKLLAAHLRVSSLDIVKALATLWDRTGASDPAVGTSLVYQLQRIAKQLPGRAAAINVIAWKIGYSNFSPGSPAALMHFMASNIPKSFLSNEPVLCFLCQCICDSSLDLINRLALWILIANEVQLSKIWEEYVVPSIPPDNEAYVTEVTKLLVAKKFALPLRQLLRNNPEKLFVASAQLPIEYDAQLLLPEPYSTMRAFARNLSLPSDLRVFTLCSAAAFDTFLAATVEGQTPASSQVIADMKKLTAIGATREEAGLPGLMESLIACFQILEKVCTISNEFLVENYCVQLQKKFKTIALSIQTDWCTAPPFHRNRIRISCQSIVAAINVFARLELDASFEALVPLLSLVNFVSEFPRRCIAQMATNLIRFVNTKKPVPLWRLEYVDAVLPHLPQSDENAHKLVATLCKIRLLKGVWHPEPPPSDISWQQIGRSVCKLPCMDVVNHAYLRCYAAGVGSANERAAAALYSYLLTRDKSLIFSAACFASSDCARGALLQFIDEHASEISEDHLELSRILCGRSVSIYLPFNKLVKADVLRVSYELEYQGRLHDAGGLALVDPFDIAQQYRKSVLRGDKKLFYSLERKSHPNTFETVFWRVQAQLAFDQPTDIQWFWSLAKIPSAKCQSLLYVAMHVPKMNAPAVLALALKAFEIVSFHKKDIPAWLYPVIRKQSLKIIVEKYATLGLVDWAIRYGYEPSSLESLVVDDDIDVSGDLHKILCDISDYLVGTKRTLQPDPFGIQHIEYLLTRGNASEIENASKKCLEQLWTACENKSDGYIRQLHPILSDICSMIVPYCSFVTVGLIYKARRVQNMLQDQWPSLSTIQTLQSNKSSPLVQNNGVYQTCTAFLHCQSMDTSDTIYVTRVFTATENTPQMCSSFRVKLPARTISSLVDRLYSILANNEKTAKESLRAAAESDTNEVRHKFWTERKRNDDLVHALLNELDQTCPWLSWMLAGIPIGWQYALQLADQDPIVAMIICGSPTANDLKSLKDNLQYGCDDDVVFEAAKKWRCSLQTDEQPPKYRQLVTLFLDAELCKLPLEMLPRLDLTPFTREVYQRLSFADSVHSQRVISVSEDAGYYVLNPDGSLPRQNCLLKLCQALRWCGRHLETPSATEVYSKLSSSKVFLYAGHNGGEWFVDMEEIQKGGHRAAWASTVLLMGCSTAAPRDVENESFNACFHYLIGGSPFVVGNLWGVLSNDCDMMCTSMLKLWKVSNPKSGVTPHLAVALAMSRKSPKFPYLTGASAVCFGSDDFGSEA